jgi:hypothetical protein
MIRGISLYNIGRYKEATECKKNAGNASYAVWGCTSWVLNSFTTRVIKKLINRIDTVDAANEPIIDA